MNSHDFEVRVWRAGWHGEEFTMYDRYEGRMVKVLKGSGESNFKLKHFDGNRLFVVIGGELLCIPGDGLVSVYDDSNKSLEVFREYLIWLIDRQTFPLNFNAALRLHESDQDERGTRFLEAFCQTAVDLLPEGEAVDRVHVSQRLEPFFGSEWDPRRLAELEGYSEELVTRLGPEWGGPQQSATQAMGQAMGVIP